MTEEIEHEEPVQEEQVDSGVDDQQEEAEGDSEQKTVPLSALKAERKKRQEIERKAQELENRERIYQDYLKNTKKPQEPVEEEDLDSLVERRQLKDTMSMTKREIREELYQDMNPDAVHEINTYLKPILEKKPWLADSIDGANNRYARAHEIVKDFMHLVVEKPKAKGSLTDGERIVQNSKKPGSPADIAKSASPSKVDFLKSIQGKTEFREYRQKVRRGEVG